MNWRSIPSVFPEQVLWGYFDEDTGFSYVVGYSGDTKDWMATTKNVKYRNTWLKATVNLTPDGVQTREEAEEACEEHQKKVRNE